jgi:hypothetical protein
MAQCKVISGLTAKTTENLVLDAGAFFKNFIVEPAEGAQADTFESAVTAGKLLGATKGGGSFSAVPTFRPIEADGARGAVKGLQLVETWEVKMGAKLLEVTVSTLEAALASAVASTVAQKTKLTAKVCLSDDDYIDNITWVGNLSGSEEPVIIQIYNALNTKGLELTFEDKGEAVIETEFVGHYEMGKLETPPFAIYYPAIGG